MISLFMPIWKNIIKKKEAITALCFSLFPFIIVITDLFNTNFMQLSAPKGSMSFLDFFQAVEYVQYQIALPSIAFIYLTCSIFHDEISSGLLFLYKDIKRSKIFFAKFFSIVCIYLIYIVCTFIASLLTYYFHLINRPYTSGKFLPSSTSDLQYDITSVLGICCISILCFLLVSLLSIHFNNGFTMIMGILFMMVSFIAPMLKGLRYFLPNGYTAMISKLGFNLVLTLMLTIFIIYFAILYTISIYLFDNLEF